MNEKAMDVYQGDDWFTYRWAVAQVFDTLDRMREVCGHAPMPVTEAVRVSGSKMPLYEPADEEMLEDMFGCIAGLCDDLSGELDAALADLFWSTHHATQQRWMGFEIQLHLNSIRQQAYEARANADLRLAALDQIVALTSRMRDLLKQIDQ